jgi:hypothetical protein
MKRRDFLSGVGGAVAVPLTFPLVAGAQQGERLAIVGSEPRSDAHAELAERLAIVGWGNQSLPKFGNPQIKAVLQYSK